MSRLRGNEKTNEASNTEETANGDHTRQLGSTTHMDKFYKKFFMVYLTEECVHLTIWHQYIFSVSLKFGT